MNSNQSDKRIFLASPHMSEEGYEMEYIQDAFEKNFIAPLGENVNQFEIELAERLGAKEAAALSSGTAAIHMALLALEIGRGDLVFCQSLTFSATANPITYVGAKPVFIDSEEETWNMSPLALKRALEKYRRLGRLPKAVIMVHLYGQAAKVNEILEICNTYQVPVIEDAAESLGTEYKGRQTGTFGQYGIFSFNGNKIITTSGGGMLICNLEEERAKERIEKVRFWSTQARDKALFYQHSEVGYNYRMSNIVAGIGRGQLKVLKKRIEKKKELFRYYEQELGCLEGVYMMPQNSNSRNNNWLSCMLLDERLSIKPLDIILALEKENIESRPIWKPLHIQPVFAECDFVSTDKEGHLRGKETFSVIDVETGADNSVAGKLFASGICLPSDTKNTPEDKDRICNIIKNLWN